MCYPREGACVAMCVMRCSVRWPIFRFSGDAAGAYHAYRRVGGGAVLYASRLYGRVGVTHFPKTPIAVPRFFHAEPLRLLLLFCGAAYCCGCAFGVLASWVSCCSLRLLCPCVFLSCLRAIACFGRSIEGPVVWQCEYSPGGGRARHRTRGILASCVAHLLRYPLCFRRKACLGLRGRHFLGGLLVCRHAVVLFLRARGRAAEASPRGSKSRPIPWTCSTSHGGVSP